MFTKILSTALYSVLIDYNDECLPPDYMKLGFSVFIVIGDMRYTFNFNVTPVTLGLTLELARLFVSVITQGYILMIHRTQTRHPMLLEQQQYPQEGYHILWKLLPDCVWINMFKPTPISSVRSRKTFFLECIWPTLEVVRIIKKMTHCCAFVYL